MVVFDVSGYISLHSPVTASSNITIAGQSAPGGGIGLMGNEVSFSKASNVICRDIRFRQGLYSGGRGKSAVNIGDSHNIIFDHCSFEFGEWDTIDAVHAVDFTIQDSIIADPIGQQFGAHVEGGPASFIRDIWANAHNRQPLAKCNTQFINNVVYNYNAGYTVGRTSGTHSHDILNNFFIAGPSTSNPSDCFFQMDSRQSVFASGNILDATTSGLINGSLVTPKGVTSLAVPWSSLTTAIQAVSAFNAYHVDVESSGAQPRDEVDSQVIEQVTSLGTAGSLLRSQSADGLGNGGLGQIPAGVNFPSKNGDGVPDYWRLLNAIEDSREYAASSEYLSSGYSIIEAYLNSLVLPPGWKFIQEGPAVPPAQASYNSMSDTWILASQGGSDVADDNTVVFADHPLAGDCALVAEVTSVTGLRQSSTAGASLRASTKPDSDFVEAQVTPTNVRLFCRTNGVSSTSLSSNSEAVKLPVWLKIARLGDTVAAFYKTTGVSWKELGKPVKVNFGATTDAGLTASVAGPGLAAASYRSVSVN
jgi:hypothetical protein